jgi:hypothetical protein
MTDVTELARMSSIACNEIERALEPSRATTKGGMLTFILDSDWVNELVFAVSDVMRRAKSVDERFDALFGDDGEVAAVTKPAPEGYIDGSYSERGDLLNELESSHAVLSGLVDAVSNLSACTDNPAARLRGISAIVGGMQEHTEAAKDAVRDLYALHFSEKSTG